MQLLEGGLSTYKDVQCAGAVILVGRGMLIVVRPLNGRKEWLLPKGHIHEGESPLDAAIREAKEETGAVCSAEDPGPLKTTTHVDHERKEIKSTIWFLLRAAAVKSELAETLLESATTKREIGIFPTVVAFARLTYEDHRDVLATVLGGRFEDE
jgi:8-oxo-dGTP pyrophosphatase MutT (NUDIX family)